MANRSAARRTVETLESRRDELVRRLENGSRQIDELRSAGGDTAEWESFWIRLLAEYESVCDELRLARAAAPLARAS